jgi:adenosyl cobinamide kinase/adenosyl cobinamide phosphate guanylyltransferase
MDENRTATSTVTLVLGGARSGKSEVAERLVASFGLPVAYLATARVDDGDEELVTRITAHRSRRPSEWLTLEVGDDLAGALGRADGVALVDSLGTWVARLPGFAADADRLCAVLRSRPGPTVVVSEEVGLGVHPSTEAGRHFRDALGALNTAVAAVADDVLLVVAGRVLRLDVVPGPKGMSP